MFYYFGNMVPLQVLRLRPRPGWPRPRYGPDLDNKTSIWIFTEFQPNLIDYVLDQSFH